MRKVLGKIIDAKFGKGGYQEAMIGLSVTLEGDGGCCGDFWGQWATKRQEYCEWTEESRLTKLGEVVMKLNDILTEAKKDHVSQLVGVPVEITFDGNFKLVEWRVLKEVL